MFFGDMGVKLALNKLRDIVINPKLAGIGTVDELVWKDRELFVKLRLNGLEDRPIEVKCAEISFGADGATVTAGSLISDMPFVQTALDRFVVGRPFTIPEGGPRMAVTAARAILGI